MNWRRRIEPLVRPLVFMWFRMHRGMTLGVRAVVEDGQGRVVLVKHTYVPGWHLPGGGVERGEPATLAVRRELEEEAGVSPAGEPQLIGIFSNHVRFRGDHVLLYRIADWSGCETDHEGEIEAVDWFAPDNLPADTSPSTRQRLREIYEGVEVSTDW